MRALEMAGAYVLPVHYDDSSIASDRERFESGVRRDVRGALAHYQPDRLTLVGKSRGTFALALLCAEDFGLPADTRLIWLTPVWRQDATWQTARSNTIPSIYVVGLADHRYHDPERHSQMPGETVEVSGGDHGLEVAGDIFATLDAWRTMAAAIHRFASRS